MTEIILSSKDGSLPRDRHPAFFAAVLRGNSDAELAFEFHLRERTATNWRQRAETLARELKMPLPSRRKQKGGAASDGNPHDQTLEACARNGDCTPAASPTPKDRG